MEQHWSKDYIEHLRAVHFALILLCTAGIIIALAPGRTEISPARQQLEQIRSLVGNWDPRFLQAPATDSGGTILLPEASVKLTVNNQDLLVNLESRQAGAFVTLKTPSKLSSRTDCNAKPDHTNRPASPLKVADAIAAPRTVQDFKDLWNALLDGATLHRPSWMYGKVFSRRVGKNQPFEQVGFAEFKKTPKAQTLALRLQCLVEDSRIEINKLDNEVDSEFQLHGVVHAGGMYNLYLPIESDDTYYDAQELLFRDKNQTWHYGDFGTSFRELDEALTQAAQAGNQPLTWKQAVAMLADQEKRTPTESFEAFGMKLPATASAYGALLIILGLQWYLWAQIYEFRRKLKASHDVPDAAWISLYDSVPARALTLTSMFLLPVLAITALGARGARSYVLEHFSWPVSVIGLLLSATLALATYRAMPRAQVEAERVKSTSAGS